MLTQTLHITIYLWTDLLRKREHLIKKEKRNAQNSYDITP